MPTPNTLTWNPDPSATSFNIYRGTSAANISPTPYATGVLSSPYSDTGVVSGAQYFYQITGVANGQESARSPIIESAPVPFGFSPQSPDYVGLDNFAVLAGSTITNTGATEVAGDVGVSPGSSITGFPPGSLSGVLHSADYVSLLGEATAQALFNNLASQVNYPTTGVISADLGGQTLSPGVYTASSSAAITGTLTLDAGGNPAAVFIFQIGSTLTTAASNSTVLLVNGGNPGNIFWQVGSSATLGTNTTFAGTIVAQASITANTGATISGRLLALTGAVTLSDNQITLFDASPFMIYAAGQAYTVGEVTFNCGTQMFEEVIVAGTTQGALVLPAVDFPTQPGIQTQDGTVTWLSVSPAGIFVQLPLPPSPPNVAPAPPATPTGLAVAV